MQKPSHEGKKIDSPESVQPRKGFIYPSDAPPADLPHFGPLSKILSFLRRYWSELRKKREKQASQPLSDTVRGYEAHLDLADTFTLPEGASFSEMYAAWTPWTGKGIEHLHLTQNDQGIVVDNLVVGVKDGQSFRIQYCLRCDKDWKIQDCIVRRFGARPQELKLQADGQGHWVNAAGVALPTLDGCIDVDISATPFTNSLPIRRLALCPGQSADILAVYIAIPEVEARAMKQRYTCLESSNDGGLYRYENLASGFVTELRVDAQGLVLDYPERWRRSWDESFMEVKKPYNLAE